MSTTLLLGVKTVQLMPVLRLLAVYSALGAVLLTFSPLLVGILRAAWLVFFPRLSQAQRQRRALDKDRRVIDALIASSTGPSLTAELRAIAARQ